MVTLTSIVRNVGRRVKQTMNAVSSVVPDHTVSVRRDVLLDDVANLSEAFARFHNLNGLAQRLVRHLDQVLVLLRHIAHEKGFVQITMKITMVNGHIHVAQISILYKTEIESRHCAIICDVASVRGDSPLTDACLVSRGRSLR